MGIHQLTKVIQQHAPKCLKKREIKYYENQQVAIDASLSIYQFLIAIRGDNPILTTNEGQTTSHLVGMFYRTIRMISTGIKPLYVFDGLPPNLKSGEINKRQLKAKEAIIEYEKAVEEDDKEKIEKYDKRKTRVNKKHNDDCKKLLFLMGVPYVEAPSEAEAFCAYLSKIGKVYGVATEDMDALTFGSRVLLRNMNASESKKLPINEYDLNLLLKEFEMNMDEFIDLCILLGCDYCDSVKGVGPQKAFSLIKKHRCIENIIENEKKIEIPDQWKFEEARLIFKTLSTEIGDYEIIKAKGIDEAGLIEFLVKENGFSEDRIRGGIEKMKKQKGKPTQTRLDAFLQIDPSK